MGEFPPPPSYQALAEAARTFDLPLDDDPFPSVALETFAAEPPLLLPHWSWRGRFELPRVRTQGGWNACVSFAAVAAIESQLRLTQGDRTELIPGFLHNCVMGVSDPDHPVQTGQVLDACVSRGVAVGRDDRLPQSGAVCATTNVLRIAGWQWETGRNVILNRLTQHGPLLATLYVNLDFFSHRGSGVYQFDPGRERILHAVLVTGYNVTQGWAEFLNSGGPDWGESGFGRVRIGSGDFLTPRSAASVRLRP